LIDFNYTYSVKAWATREAKKRLEERGEDLAYPMTEKPN